MITQPLSNEEIHQLIIEHKKSWFRRGTFVSQIAHELQLNNRFFVDERFLKLLYSLIKLPIFSKLSYRLRKGSIIYRARLIYKNDEDKINTQENFYGFNDRDSFVPPNKVDIKEGRVNPTKICYLYASSKPTICISEVRAKPMEKVSIAKILIEKNLKLFNVTAYNGLAIPIEYTDEEAFLLDCLQNIGSAFMEPCRSPEDYLLSQLVAEYVKNLGYDGIMHISSENHRGHNFDIFNYEKCKAISSKAYIVFDTKIKYGEWLNH